MASGAFVKEVDNEQGELRNCEKADYMLDLPEHNEATERRGSLVRLEQV